MCARYDRVREPRAALARTASPEHAVWFRGSWGAHASILAGAAHERALRLWHSLPAHELGPRPSLPGAHPESLGGAWTVGLEILICFLIKVCIRSKNI